MTCLLPLVLAFALRGDSVDVLVKGGTVYDGSGGSPRVADVGLRGDRIVFLGNAAKAQLRAGLIIDATGLVVAPGFIDPHSHVLQSPETLGADKRRAAGELLQGVTTVTISPDGRGPVDVARVLGDAESLGLGVNIFATVGFGTVRARVLGSSSARATPAQIDSMRALIDKGMREGAYGVGAGLYYVPQRFSSTEEVIAVVSAAKPYGGVYDSHQRDEGTSSIGLMHSTREAMRIGRESGLTTNLGHVKALGPDVWGYADSVLRAMRDERGRGHMVVADQYPWTASGTSVQDALVPAWAQAGGRDSLLARIADAAARVRLLADMRENLRSRGGDSTLLLISGGPRAQPFLGKTLKQVAADKGMPAAETALELVRDGLNMGVASFNMTEADIESFMKDPFVMTSSDGSGGHPRLFGTYPRKIRRYVLDKPVITMERMVQSSSAQVADVYGLKERGALKTGYYADVIVFDPRTIREAATYAEPEKLSIGMRWVFVNGQAAVADGQPTGAMAGRGLRKR